LKRLSFGVSKKNFENGKYTLFFENGKFYWNIKESGQNIFIGHVAQVEDSYRINLIDYIDDGSMKFESDEKLVEHFFSLFELCIKDLNFHLKTIVEIKTGKLKELGMPYSDFKLSWDLKYNIVTSKPENLKSAVQKEMSNQMVFGLNVKLYDHEGANNLNYQNIIMNYKGLLKSVHKSKEVSTICLTPIEEAVFEEADNNKFKTFLKQVYVPGAMFLTALSDVAKEIFDLNKILGSKKSFENIFTKVVYLAKDEEEKDKIIKYYYSFLNEDIEEFKIGQSKAVVQEKTVEKKEEKKKKKQNL